MCTKFSLRWLHEAFRIRKLKSMEKRKLKKRRITLSKAAVSVDQYKPVPQLLIEGGFSYVEIQQTSKLPSPSGNFGLKVFTINLG